MSKVAVSLTRHRASAPGGDGAAARRLWRAASAARPWQNGGMQAGRIRIGTSGWHYPSGAGTWNGIFYPARGPPPPPAPASTSLTWYSERFDTVEVNSTFYGVPKPSVTASWVERTPPGFEFSLKLYQKFTHPRMFAAATGRTDTTVGRSDVDEFREAIDPLHRAGRMGALLAQFPASFKNDTAAHDHLAWLIEALSDCTVAVELRHRSWSDDVAGTLRPAERAGGRLGPESTSRRFRFSIAQNFLPNVETFYYMRLHGRNAKQWWRHARTEDRYDYHYSAEELRRFSRTVEAAGRIAQQVYLYTNNHFAAKSVANAALLTHQLGRTPAGAYRAEMVARYPELAPIVTVEAADRALPLPLDR